MTTAIETAPSATALPDAPYRGIEPFRYIDQPIFFAREEETRKLLRYVAVYRGVLFYGDSGSGKSSLINAGFIPAIIKEGFTPDRLRVQPRPGEEIIVERISMSPDGAAPYLHSNLSADEDTATRTIIPAAQLKEKLLALPDDRRPLLIFDQFEEFATLFESVPRGEAVAQAHEAQSAILKMLVELLRYPSLPVKLLFVFREDYLAKLNKLVVLFPDLSDQYLRLTSPGAEALHKIIRGSFEKFPGHFGKELSEDLTVQLGQAIQERSEGGKLNLSEVQIACLELWKSEKPAELFKQKGVQGLLEGYLSDSLTKLPLNLRAPAVALLSRMVTPSGTRNIVSEYDLISQVQEDDGVPEDLLKDALRALVQETKLVRRERRYDTYFYDIVSEFLVPWIMQQKADRLAEAERQKAVTLAADERRKKRLLFIAAIFWLVVAAIIAAGAWYVYTRRTQAALAQDTVKQAVQEKEEAINLSIKAEGEKIVAEQERDEAVSAKTQAERITSEAQQQIQAISTAKALAEQQRDRALGEVERVRNEMAAKQGAQLQAANENIRNLQQQLDKKDQEIKRRTYLQIDAEEKEQEQSARAITAEKALTACRKQQSRP